MSGPDELDRANDQLAAELGLTADMPVVRRLRLRPQFIPYVCTAELCRQDATRIVARGGLWRYWAACDDPQHLDEVILQDLTEPPAMEPTPLDVMAHQLEPDG